MEAKVLEEPGRAWREFPGEDLATSALPEVAGWIAIYEEMVSVLRSVISRADGSGEVEELRGNLLWIEQRLASWRDRHAELAGVDRKSTRLNSSHSQISYAVFCLKKKRLR